MAIKQDRPADHGDDGVVVYVAKSVDEVNQARASLQEAGVPVDLPPAAIEALFAAGRSSLPIRVAAMDFRKAQDVIDEIFPPPLLELPPLPGQSEAKGKGGSKGKAKQAPGPSGAQGSAEEDSEGEGRVDAYRPEPSNREGSVRKLEGSATKLLFIALASLVLPGLGVLTGIFAAFSSWWCLDRLPFESGSARARAKAAFGLALSAILLWIGAGAYYLWLNA